MKKIATFVAAVALVAVLTTLSMAQEPKPAPTDEFQRGWCAGWVTASNVSAQNFNNWLKFLQVGQPKLKTDKSPVGEATRIIIDSIPRYIIISDQVGKVTLGDGTVIDCVTYKPVAK